MRLPAAFRFEGNEVYIRRDPTSGDVILSRKPQDWKEFLTARDVDDPSTRNFLKDREDKAPDEREPF